MNDAIQSWLSGPYDEETKREIRRLLKDDPKALSDAFYKDLSFGTGGMRGLMGVGTNRLNSYTIRRATQGLANCLKKGSSVFVGYDVRNHSKEFAYSTARTLAANEIKVYLSEEICPTPMVSFGCRYFKCQAAIMITASHNPPEYNGYKVYGEDGGQITHPFDEQIIDEVNKVNTVPPLSPSNSPLITVVGSEIDVAYLTEMKKLQLCPNATDVDVIYSPLHGTGIRNVPAALKAFGFSSVHLVDEQSTPDGNFPTASSPNPEELAALKLGRELLLKERGDLLIATDPDADRIGVVSKEGVRLSGNQVACLLLDHICSNAKLPSNAAFVKTIVTTELFAKIVKNYGAILVDVLTGFKYIGEKIALWEKDKSHTFVFGAEESCGYLFGDSVRDKDAISSACLIAEVAAVAKQNGKTLLDLLHDLYRKYGVHLEHLLSLKFPETEESMIHINEKMNAFRKSPPKEISLKKVVRLEDFLHGSKRFPSSNVIRLWLEDETKVVVRPSGTEPKIKIYIQVARPISSEIDKDFKMCQDQIQSIEETIKKLF